MTPTLAGSSASSYHQGNAVKIGSTMSYETLVITDLHGNLDALRRAVERAEQTARLRYLVLGGDLAPNLVTVRLRDGEFVLPNDELDASLQAVRTG